MQNIDISNFTSVRAGSRLLCGLAVSITFFLVWLLSDETQVVWLLWSCNVANSREMPTLPTHFILVTV